MSAWAYDTFSVPGLLSSHTPDTPGTGTWAVNTNYSAGTSPSISNGVCGVTAITTLLSCPGTAVSAEYDVSVDAVFLTLSCTFGVAGRIQADGHGYFGGWITGSWRIYRTAAGNSFTILSSVVTDGTIAINTPYRIKLQIRNPGGANVTSLALLVSTDGGVTYTTKIAALTDTNSALTPAGQPGLYLNSGANAATLDNFAALDVAGIDFHALLSSTLTGQTGVTATLAGTNTAWTAGTPGTPTFTISGTNGATLTSQVVTSATAASLTLNTGSTPGTVVITDPSTGNTVSFNITAPPFSIAPNNVSWQWSPYNWESNGSSWKRSQMQGAYSLVAVTGTTSITLLLDMSAENSAGIPSTNFPYLSYSINNSAVATVQTTATSTSLLLLNNLDPAKTYIVELWNRATDILNTGYHRFNVPASYVTITGLQVDGGAGAVSTAALWRSKNMIVYGDSITAGHGSDAPVTTDDGVDAYGQSMAFALGAEIGIVGFGSSGWEGGGTADTPPFFTVGNDTLSSWNKQATGVSRLVAGKFSPVPDYVVVNHGINGTTTQPTVQGWLTAARAACAPTTPIIVVAPFGTTTLASTPAATLLAAVTAQGDPYVYYVRLPDRTVAGMGGSVAGNTQETADGIHLRTQFAARVGGAIAAQIMKATATGGGGGGSFIPGGYE